MLHTTLVLIGKLNGYLADFDNQKKGMFDLLVKQLLEKEGITERLKAKD